MEKKLTTIERRFQEMRIKAENRAIDDLSSHIENLKEKGNLFIQEHNFKVGDLVIWKKDLKNKLKPAYNEPCMVVDILNTPLIDETKNSATVYFKEPLDIVLGLITEENDFITFHYDKRRFEPYKQ